MASPVTLSGLALPALSSPAVPSSPLAPLAPPGTAAFRTSAASLHAEVLQGVNLVVKALPLPLLPDEDDSDGSTISFGDAADPLPSSASSTRSPRRRVHAARVDTALEHLSDKLDRLLLLVGAMGNRMGGMEDKLERLERVGTALAAEHGHSDPAPLSPPSSHEKASPRADKPVLASPSSPSRHRNRHGRRSSKGSPSPPTVATIPEVAPAPVLSTDEEVREHFQSITVEPVQLDLSFEELRIQDYSRHCRYGHPDCLPPSDTLPTFQVLLAEREREATAQVTCSTSTHAFQPTQESGVPADPGCELQSITCMKPYCKTSLEELRLADYSKGLRFKPTFERPAHTSTSPTLEQLLQSPNKRASTTPDGNSFPHYFPSAIPAVPSLFESGAAPALLASPAFATRCAHLDFGFGEQDGAPSPFQGLSTTTNGLSSGEAKLDDGRSAEPVLAVQRDPSGSPPRVRTRQSPSTHNTSSSPAGRFAGFVAAKPTPPVLPPVEAPPAATRQAKSAPGFDPAFSTVFQHAPASVGPSPIPTMVVQPVKTTTRSFGGRSTPSSAPSSAASSPSTSPSSAPAPGLSAKKLNTTLSTSTTSFPAPVAGRPRLRSRTSSNSSKVLLALREEDEQDLAEGQE